MKQNQILFILVVLMFATFGPSSAQITDVSAYREVIADIHDFPEAYPNVGDLVFDSSLNVDSFEADLTAAWEDGLCRTTHASSIEVLDQTINFSATLTGELSRSADGAPNIFDSRSFLSLTFYTALPLNFWVEHLRAGDLQNSAIWLMDDETTDVLYYQNSQEENGSWMSTYTGSGYYRLEIVHYLETTSDIEFESAGSLEFSMIFSTDDVVATEEKSWNSVKALYRDATR